MFYKKFFTKSTLQKILYKKMWYNVNIAKKS
jgi:hypothetical protein